MCDLDLGNFMKIETPRMENSVLDHNSDHKGNGGSEVINVRDEDSGNARKKRKINQMSYTSSVRDMKTRNKTVSASSASSCDVCSEKVDHTHFRCQKDYKNSNVTHAGARVFACEVCDKVFTRETNLKSHMLTHTKAKTFKCHVCSQKFIQKTDLTHHFAMHMELKDGINQRNGSMDSEEKEWGINKEGFTSTEKQKKWKTEVSDEELSQSSYKSHEVQQTDLKELICETCGLSFKQENDLQKHTLTHAEGKDYTCVLCNEKFTQKKNLMQHMTLHSRPKNFRCTFCIEEFVDMTALKQHMEIHSPLIEIKCQFCGKQLSSVANLRCHVAKHCKRNRKQVFRCKVCCKEFSLKSELSKHMKIHTESNHQYNTLQEKSSPISHSPTYVEAKIFKCHLCEAKFPLKEDLKFHMMKHMVKKDFQCRFCAKHFKKNCDLVSHMVTHSWIENFRCHVCGEGFRLKTALRRHMIQHTEMKYYRCRVCGKDILWKKNLESHMKKHLNKRILHLWKPSPAEDPSTETDPLFIGNEKSDGINDGSLSTDTVVPPSSSHEVKLEHSVKIENNQDNVVYIKCEIDDDESNDIVKEEENIIGDEKLDAVKDKMPFFTDSEISSSFLDRVKLEHPIKIENDPDNVGYVNCDFSAEETGVTIKKEVLS